MTGPQTIDPHELLDSAEELEALPVTVSRLYRVVTGGSPDAREIVDVVALDQALAAMLIRRANSAAAGGRQHVATVHDAVVRLGSSAVLSYALASSVSRHLKRPLPAYGMAEGVLWKRSVAASIAADLVRVRSTAEVPLETSTAALLHDFGKVVLSQHFGPHVLGLLDRAAGADGMDLLAAETAVLGVDHAGIGAAVAQRWKLPYSVVDAILHHHDTDSDLMPMAAAVSLAHAMVPDVLRAAGRPAGDDEVPVFESHLGVMVRLGLAATDYPELAAEARDQYTVLAGRYGLT